MNIATLGPQGTYSEEAARLYAKRLGNPKPNIIFTTVSNSLRLVQNRQADYAVVPVENMIDGIIGSSLDLLIEFQDFVKVCDEIHLPLSHVLAAHPDSNWSSINKIFSHPSPLNQCQNQLENLFPNTDLIAVASTSEAAQNVMDDNQHRSAAICNLKTAMTNQMKIFDQHPIQDYPLNETRFFVCALQDACPTGNDRTLMAVRYGTNHPGQLFQTAQHLADANVDLTYIQSRPYKIKPQEYVLIFEFIGHKSQPNVEKALRDIEIQVRSSDGWKKILGSYPKREREVLE